MAQQKSCVIDLPVGLIGTDGSLLEGLTAQDITVRSSKQTLRIQAVNYDTTPRRVLLIVDTSRRLVPEQLAKDLRDNTRALYPEYFDPCSRKDAH